jgi:hypothetical protein
MYSKSAILFLVIIVKRMGVFIIKIRVSIVSLFLFYLNDNWPKEASGV